MRERGLTTGYMLRDQLDDAIPKLYMRVCADNKLKRRKITRKKNPAPGPLNSSP